MPIEFMQESQLTGSSDKNLFKLTMSYDGSGRRISKTRWVKNASSQDWEKELVTHYTGIGTEIRENYAGPAKETKVVVNMPEGLGRYGIEDAEKPDFGGKTGDQLAGYIPNVKFEWYLKNHLGSTMLVYGTEGNATSDPFRVSAPLAAYDYRAFGEQVNLVSSNNGVDKVTENFTGKELDDEIALNYFGARYLDPMLGMWTSVDPARQFASPYLYAGNGMNPVNVIDPDGNETYVPVGEDGTITREMEYIPNGIDKVVVRFSDGKTQIYKEPPLDSYFYSKNDKGQFAVVGARFDLNMQQNADALIDEARNIWPLGPSKWATGEDFDFKNRFYENAENTVGVLNGRIMTARDVGNAIWGGWTRHGYINVFFPLLFGRPLFYCEELLIMKGIANGVALIHDKKLEDASSATMQRWGFDNYKP